MVATLTLYLAAWCAVSVIAGTVVGRVLWSVGERS